MKFILTIIIQIYWKIWPAQYKRPCVFEESCSHHVYRVTSQNGLVAGIRALLRRFKLCRAGYTVVPSHAGVVVRLVDGTIITSDEASSAIIAPLQMAANRIEQRLKTCDCYQATPFSNKGNEVISNLTPHFSDAV